METIEIYEAYDGTRFDDEEDCVRYEEKRFDWGSFRAFDEDMDELKYSEISAENIADRAQHLVIVRAKEALDVFKYYREMYGAMFPRVISDGDVFVYNWDEERWYRPADVIAKESAILNRVMEAAKK